ncbi:related to ethanolamine kinase [Cephalotrichum gorgonifer]|uniref:ethanolamine kinase n=1 Tax=Cephalotrichum gorgonifer TaxID=2041049 RepID=A0AAE8SS23_9PEZI|nr:related to ethanolamine kinase [Cephalotrichum gorgonifer]
MTTSNGVPNGAPAAPSKVPILPLSYDSADAQESALRLVYAVRPEWSLPTANVKLVRCTDGITNTLMKAVNEVEGATAEETDREAILFRAYGNGTHVIIDRQREVENHELLMAHGLAPELLARFRNGMIYRFIRGTVTSTEDLRDPTIYAAVARRLAEWHARLPCVPSAPAPAPCSNGSAADVELSRRRQSIDGAAPGKPAPNMWTVMQKWIYALPVDTEQQRARQTTLQTELNRLVKDLSRRPGLGKDGLVFAHCDLLHGNVIIQPKDESRPDETVVSFIDYEYATPSPAAFDISNHFAEWAGFECNYSVLPTRSQRRDFIRRYVEAYFSHLPGADAGVDLEEETRKLVEEVDVYRGLPGFYWGIWALIQAQISEIDFDYATYAELRLGEYWAWKEATVAGGKEVKEVPLRETRWAEA